MVKKTPDVAPENDLDLDLSVIRSAIPMSGRMIDTVVNSVQHGSETVKYLLTKQCDLIIECSVCRNFFRSLLNFLAHKRAYCVCLREDFQDPLQACTSAFTRQDEDIVIVQPEACDSEIGLKTPKKSQKSKKSKESPESQKTVREKVLDGSLELKGSSSSEYQFLTNVTKTLEASKAKEVQKTLILQAIASTSNAVRVTVEDGHSSANSSNQAEAAGDNVKSAADVLPGSQKTARKLYPTGKQSPGKMSAVNSMVRSAGGKTSDEVQLGKKTSQQGHSGGVSKKNRNGSVAMATVACQKPGANGDTSGLEDKKVDKICAGLLKNIEAQQKCGTEQKQTVIHHQSGQHVRSKQSKKWVCQTCHHTLSSRKSLRHHMKRVHSMHAHIPVSSNKGYKTVIGKEANLLQKCQTESVSQTKCSAAITCKGCQGVFRCPSDLKRHKGTCLRLNGSSQSSVVKTCKGCPRVFRHSGNLMQHERACLRLNGSSQSSVVKTCKGCPRVFRHSGNLMQHERACLRLNDSSQKEDTGMKQERPLSSVVKTCKGCGRMFNNFANLVRHEHACLRSNCSSQKEETGVKPGQSVTTDKASDNGKTCSGCQGVSKHPGNPIHHDPACPYSNTCTDKQLEDTDHVTCEQTVAGKNPTVGQSKPSLVKSCRGCKKVFKNSFNHFQHERTCLHLRLSRRRNKGNMYLPMKHGQSVSTDRAEENQSEHACMDPNHSSPTGSKHGQSSPTGKAKETANKHSVVTSCRGCKRAFNNRGNLFQHERACLSLNSTGSKMTVNALRKFGQTSTESKAKVVSCKGCKRVFNNRGHLFSHERACLSLNSSKMKANALVEFGQTSAKGKAKVSCKGCKRAFNNRGNLFRHERACLSLNSSKMRVNALRKFGKTSVKGKDKENQS